jgi:hypothetical protein
VKWLVNAMGLSLQRQQNRDQKIDSVIQQQENCPITRMRQSWAVALALLGGVALVISIIVSVSRLVN